MHASALAALPPSSTGMRDAGAMGRYARCGSRNAAFFTIDAGPHVKALCRAPTRSGRGRAREVPGVCETLVAAPGPAARVVEGA